jgi:hypothetical protein
MAIVDDAHTGWPHLVAPVSTGNGSPDRALT